MANMAHVNQYIKANFPELDIKAVRGDGYVYFDGDDGFDKVESIYVHAPSISTIDKLPGYVKPVRWRKREVM